MSEQPLSRHLVIDVQEVSDSFHLYLLLSITAAIVMLSFATMALTYTVRKFGRPEDDVAEQGRAIEQANAAD